MFCDRVAKGETKSCRLIGSLKLHKAEKTGNPIHEAHLKAYRRMNSKARTKRIPQGEFLAWSDEARAKRDACLNGELPFDIRQSILYYMGPTPAREGRIIGSAGPTTSGRMDKYTPRLLDLGLKGMIGKGKRSDEVKEAIIRNGAVYFAAVGGAGALLSKCITSSEIIAYEDLGTEAVHKLIVKDFPVITVIDAEGTDLYLNGKEGIIP